MRLRAVLPLASLLITTTACMATEEQCKTAKAHTIDLVLKEFAEKRPITSDEMRAEAHKGAQEGMAGFMERCRKTNSLIVDCQIKAKSTAELQECVK